MAREVTWHLRRGASLNWRGWGDESVVFDPETGDTHLLDLVSREGLSCLEERPLTRVQLCEQLAARLDIDADPQLNEYVARLLNRLSELGLLEASEP